jgi:hypothetical protein
VVVPWPLRQGCSEYELGSNRWWGMVVRAQ